MTDDELTEALAAKLRAYATAPLADAEVHEWDQVGYEGTSGAVVVRPGMGSQQHIAIGEQLMDTLPLEIVGYIEHADTQANRRFVATMREQILKVLRSNRTLTAGGENARTNAAVPITWEYGVAAEGEKIYRYCTVAVTYEKVPDAV